jgi:hypothetical protein
VWLVISDPEAGLFAQRQGRPRDHLTSTGTRPISACSLAVSVPVMGRTNQRAYQSTRPATPSRCLLREGRRCHDLLLGLLTGSVPGVDTPDTGINSVRAGLASRYAVSLSSTPDILSPVNSGGATSRTSRRSAWLTETIRAWVETRPLSSNLGIPPVRLHLFTPIHSTGRHTIGRVRRSTT